MPVFPSAFGLLLYVVLVEVWEGYLSLLRYSWEKEEYFNSFLEYCGYSLIPQHSTTRSILELSCSIESNGPS